MSGGKKETMKVKLVTATKDDFDDRIGPSKTTTVFLSLDGMLFDIGRFYEGSHQNDDTIRRLSKVLEFGKWLDYISEPNDQAQHGGSVQ